MADKTLGDLIFDLVVDDKQFQSAIETSISTIKGVESAVAKMADSSIANFKRMASEAESLAAALAKIQSPTVAAPAAAAAAPARFQPMTGGTSPVYDGDLAQRKKKAEEASAFFAKKMQEESAIAQKTEQEKRQAVNQTVDTVKKAEEEKRKEVTNTASVAIAAIKQERAARKNADTEAIKLAKQQKDAQTDVIKSLGSAGEQVASSIQTAFKATTIAIASIGTAITVLGAKFESTINTVSVLSGGGTGTLSALTDAAREFGTQSKFSAQEAADAMLNFAQAGMDAEENIAATSSAIKLAAASGSDLSLSTSIMSDAMSQFNLKSEEAANLADIFAFALNDSKLGMSDLSVSMRYAGTVGAGFNMSLQETTAALMLFADLGLRGSKAGTVFRQMMNSAANTTSEADRVLKSYGLTQESINPTTKKFGDILKVVADAGIGVDDAMVIFGQTTGANVVALAEAQKQAGETGKSFDNLVTRMNGAIADGLAGKTAAEMMNNVADQFRLMVAKLADIGYSIYFAFAEPLKNLIVEVSSVTDSIISAFGLASDSISGSVGVALANLTDYIRENRTQIVTMAIAMVDGFSRVTAQIISLAPMFMELTAAAFRLGGGIINAGDAVARMIPFVDNLAELLVIVFSTAKIVQFNAYIAQAAIKFVELYDKILLANKGLTTFEILSKAAASGFGGIATFAISAVVALSAYIATSAEAELATERLTLAQQRQKNLDDAAAQEELDRIKSLLTAAQDRAFAERNSGGAISESRKKEIETLIHLEDASAKLLLEQGKLIVSQGQLRTTAALTEENFNAASYDELKAAYVAIRQEADALNGRIGPLSEAVKRHTVLVSGSFKNAKETSETAGSAIAASTGESVSTLEEASALLDSLQKALKTKQAQISKTKNEALKAEGDIREEADKGAGAMGRFGSAAAAAARANEQLTKANNEAADSMQRLIDEAEKRYAQVKRDLVEASLTEGQIQADRIDAQIEANNKVYDAAKMGEQRKQESAAKLRATYAIKAMKDGSDYLKKEQQELFLATATEQQIRENAHEQELQEINAHYNELVNENEGQTIVIKGIEEKRAAALAASKAKHNAQDLAETKKHAEAIVEVQSDVSKRLSELAAASSKELIDSMAGGGIGPATIFGAMKMARVAEETGAESEISKILDDGVAKYQDANADKQLSDKDLADYRLKLTKENQGKIDQIQENASKEGIMKAHLAMMSIFGNAKILGMAYHLLWTKIFKSNKEAAKLLDMFVVGLAGSINAIKNTYAGVMSVVEKISGFSLDILGTIQNAVSSIMDQQKAAIQDADQRAREAGFDPEAAARRAQASVNPADTATAFVQGLVDNALRITEVFVAAVGPVLSSLAAGLPAVFTAVADALPGIAMAFAANIGPIINAIIDGVPKVAIALIQALPIIATALVEAILVDLIPALPGIAFELAKAVVSAIWEALKGIGGAIGKAAAEFFGFDTGGPAAYSGMDYVPATMRATLHQGEAVIPADRNAKRLSGATAPAPAGAAQNYGGGYGGGGGQFEVAVIAEGRLLEAVQLKAESLGRATGMGKRIRKAAGVQVGFSRGDYNPWSR